MKVKAYKVHLVWFVAAEDLVNRIDSAHMYSRLRKTPGDNDRRTVAIVLPVIIVMICLLVRNLVPASPIMSGDSYAYDAPSRTLRHALGLSARGPYLQVAGNPVFLLIGRLFSAISSSPKDPMEAFNAPAFALSVLLVCLIMYWLSERKAPPHAPLIISLLPFSAYMTYFMPETLHVPDSACIAAARIVPLRRNESLPAWISGFPVGALLLTESHGEASWSKRK